MVLSKTVRFQGERRRKGGLTGGVRSANEPLEESELGTSASVSDHAEKHEVSSGDGERERQLSFRAGMTIGAIRSCLVCG